jgi:hypothetical protein
MPLPSSRRAAAALHQLTRVIEYFTQCDFVSRMRVEVNLGVASSIPKPVPSAKPRCLLTAVVNSTIAASEHLTVASTAQLPAESLAPGR